MPVCVISRDLQLKLKVNITCLPVPTTQQTKPVRYSRDGTGGENLEFFSRLRAHNSFPSLILVVTTRKKSLDIWCNYSHRQDKKLNREISQENYIRKTPLAFNDINAVGNHEKQVAR